MASPSGSPFQVSMSLSRISRKLKCNFEFTNTSDQDYYLCQRSTPLEGMKNRLLTVTYRRTEIPYNGILCKRAPPTRAEFKLFKPGQTVQATIDLTKGYVFEKDGLYKFEFKRSLVYLTKSEMEAIQNDKDLPRSGGLESVITATAQIELIDARRLDKPSHLK